MDDFYRTFPIKVSTVTIGGNNPISIQSMTNTKTHDITSTLSQIRELDEAGCSLIRVAVPDEKACQVFGELVKQSPVPLIADIHFDYSLAIGAIRAGASKIRINPGNIGSDDKLYKVVSEAKNLGIPIRIGINSGSLEKRLLKKHGGPTVTALVESAIDNVIKLSKMDFRDVVISIKSSDVNTTIKANEEFARRLANPLHLGVTEAGTVKQGTIKSAVGLGTLLSRGIGNTIRVSLSGSPIEEVTVAKSILTSLGLMKGVQIVSCPTCGRTDINVENLALEVEKKLVSVKAPVTVAVMGCVVNGPGEAKEADFGIAGGKEYGVLFRQGKTIKKVPQNLLLKTLLDEIDRFLEESNNGI